ncbi:MAG: N-methyl-L-tryptophan oxidase [Rhodospirillales bacterium]|jgi:sarcosine oxidase|nr:N-methyl-L-tryptophan oxidase [Rhodospirillales bacterium]MBT4041444.1 N-methyl-L-tryptophan oxidase [Rhodospirillales bacterium]MBT4626059.1 N-methyl-L-tryptophan oxidase [Rhodospirillales bacterium]MBT5520994.1 N-methyl-L-tryptophan oxidase [Rhodospirillales bacterium]MBT6108899.1 N-methyl-L-tryptophan oxidase [Rhodospirillales bacterium]
MNTYDIIVVGLGVMGGSAAFNCAKRGVKVLGLDANHPNHILGSSHGATRAIRETYFESPEYVPLSQRSAELWRELEEESGQSLLTTNGAIYVAPKDHPMAKGVVSAADVHGLDIEHLSIDDMASRFPGFALPEDWAGIYESNGGVIQAEASRKAHVDMAVKHGADLRFGCAVTGWSQNSAGNVVVTTTDGEFEAASAILTLGPWACEALHELNLPLTGRRIPIIHFDAIDASRYNADDMSVYFWATPEGIYAGFPYFDGEGVKIMRHDAGDVCTPETARRDVTDFDITEISDFANKYMPYANRSVRNTLIGLYTMTPDGHFVIDRHPGFNKVAYATGFSGHGFKFAPVIGEILADMILDGATKHPTGFLTASRFADQQLKSA